MLWIKFLGQDPSRMSWSKITKWPAFKSISAFYSITFCCFSFLLKTDFSPAFLKAEGCTLHWAQQCQWWSSRGAAANLECSSLDRVTASLWRMAAVPCFSRIKYISRFNFSSFMNCPAAVLNCSKFLTLSEVHQLCLSGYSVPAEKNILFSFN